MTTKEKKQDLEINWKIGMISLIIIMIAAFAYLIYATTYGALNYISNNPDVIALINRSQTIVPNITANNTSFSLSGIMAVVNSNNTCIMELYKAVSTNINSTIIQNNGANYIKISHDEFTVSILNKSMISKYFFLTDYKVCD